MSVQQQIDRINTEVSTQETLLDQALAAIANKAAGGGGSGGSVETCTVTIEIPMALEFLSYNDGTEWVVDDNWYDTAGTRTLTVSKGSVIFVSAYTFDGGPVGIAVSDTITVAYSSNTFHLLEVNGDGTITLIDEDL